MAEGGSCPECGAVRRFLHRHHIIPRSQGGSDEPENIALLCANCHEDRHYGVYGGPSLSRRHSHSPEAQRKRAESMKRAWAEGRFKNRKPMSPADERKRIEATRIAVASRSQELHDEIGRKSGDARRAFHAAKNAERNRRIAELRAAGVKLQAIADLLGCSVGAVQHTLKLQAEGKIPVKG